MSLKIKLAAFGLFAAFMAADAMAPAAAQPWGPPPGPGWGPPPPHRHWRPPPPRRCWTEERRVRVMTPWGPRWRTQTYRVCR